MKKLISIGVIAIVLVFVVLLAWRHFQPSPDEKLHSQIAGTWTSETSTIKFSPDGTFTVGGDTSHDAGTWQISDQMLTMTITDAAGPHPVGKAGATVRGKIIHVDSHVLSYTSGGRAISFSR